MAEEKLNDQVIFEAARRIESHEARATYLQQTCGEDLAQAERIVALLRAFEENASFLESPAVDFGLAPTFTPPVGERPGAQIGPYKLLQVIGEGGMGVVYMAEQSEPVKRKVALKLIKPGMDSRQVIARFEAERQALSMMDHVNIARVLDAGTTSGEPGGVGSGTPYFVMELIHGVPITKYCDDNHLTPRQRLELFVPVCQAIQHAHQKGIIHRDIKPSNVMVTLYDGKPVPKVIDFGVAKATEQKLTERTLFTQYGTVVGTLEYMSPEQAEMSALGVDTRSDIYSLGVLLYELLTGSTPLSSKQMKESAYAEILRLIREEEPPKPSTRLSEAGDTLASISAQRHTEPAQLTKLMRGELDWIVMKTLEKDRNRRYETAKDFADDVQRYLNDEQVLACPPSVGYRLRKFVRRNRHTLAILAMLGVFLLVAVGIAGVPATVVGAVVLAILTAGLVLLAEANRRTGQQRVRAENNLAQAQEAEKRAKGAAAKAEAINHFLINDLLAEAAPEKNAYGNHVTVEELLNRAARNIDRAFPGQPEIEAVVRHTIGRTYHSLGQWDLAEPHLYRALELRRAFLGPEHPETLEALNDLAVVLEVRGKLAEAEPLFRQALSSCGEVLGQDHPLTLLALHNLAWSLHDRDNAAEAEPLYRQCLEVRRRVLGFEHPDTLTSLHHLAWLLWDLDKPGEAGPLLRETLKFRRQVLPARHPDTTKTLTLLGWVLTDTGEATEAEPLLREALAVRRKALPAGHWLTAITANILGGCLTSQGRYAEAEPLLLESCETLQTASGFPPGRIAEVLGRLVELYEACGRDEEAVAWRGKREATDRLTDRPGRVCGLRRIG